MRVWTLPVRRVWGARGVALDGRLWLRCSRCCRGSDADVVVWPGCVVAMSCPECAADVLVTVAASWDEWDDWAQWCDGEFG